MIKEKKKKKVSLHKQTTHSLKCHHCFFFLIKLHLHRQLLVLSLSLSLSPSFPPFLSLSHTHTPSLECYQMSLVSNLVRQMGKVVIWINRKGELLRKEKEKTRQDKKRKRKKKKQEMAESVLAHLSESCFCRSLGL